jgi:hypothetical protein
VVVDEAKNILSELGMPKPQQTDLCAYTLLALANVSANGSWAKATNEFIRIHDVLAFTKDKFEVEYAENSRETFRKQAMHPFRTAAIIEDNGKATNSPNYKYHLTNETLALIQKYGSPEWEDALADFQDTHDSLTLKYASKKLVTKMPVRIEDTEYSLSVGKHNELQKAILDEFWPRFAPDSRVLYLGDTENKHLFEDVFTLEQIGIEITLHDKLPDIILYDEERDWIFFIEAVTSVGPMSPKRLIEISEITEKSQSGKIYVTAFPDSKTFKKFYDELAWETEVWIAEDPDHLIHLNGDRFIGPR